jgi:hypothetical protein
MPRSRPGKKERATKRLNDQKALNRLNDQISKDRSENVTAPRSDSRISKQPSTEDRKFSKSEVDAIVQAAVTAAVQTTTSLLTGGAKPKQEAQESRTSETKDSKPRTLAERIQFPKKSLAERIVFPKSQ